MIWSLFPLVYLIALFQIISDLFRNSELGNAKDMLDTNTIIETEFARRKAKALM